MDAAIASFDNHFDHAAKLFSGGALQSRSQFDESNEDHYSNEDGTEWDFSDKLTISFAPDGTKIGSRESSLYEDFKGFLNASRMEATILRAFQTWAVRSNINFGLVNDSGDPFGVQGRTQGDERFGDIRIGSIPMSADIFAISIPHEEISSGTWSGDLLINSNSSFGSAKEFYSVILHEAGHILGLPHSDDPSSVMHPVKRVSAPTRLDSRNLRSIYGIRNLDINESRLETNNSLELATEIDNPGKHDGEIPLVVYGDLGKSSDKDFYKIDNLNEYDGEVTFRLFNKGLSLVLPKLTVFNEDGAVIAISSQTGHRQPEASLTFRADANVDEYFVLIEASAPTSRFSVGSYALATTFDELNTKSEEELQSSIQSQYSMLDQSDLQRIIAGEGFFEDDDGNSDDNKKDARVLELDERLKQRPLYRYSGSLSNTSDVDFFKIETPKSGLTQAMVVKVTSIDESGFIPMVRVFDDNDQRVQWRYLVNGEGELVMQVDQVAESKEYKVSVQSADVKNFPTGNYDLEVGFSDEIHKLKKFSSGTLAVGRTRANQAIYIARNQLFNLGLRVSSLGTLNTKGVTVWTTLYDEFGNILHRVATRPGEMRTTNSILLDPGSYHLVTTLSYSASVKSELIEKGDVQFAVIGRQVDEPTGPELVDPTKLPFKKCSNGRKFCYPGNVSSPDPFVFVNGRPKGKPPIKVKPPKYTDVALWYWQPNKLGN